jgi:hypothetical protein
LAIVVAVSFVFVNQPLSLAQDSDVTPPVLVDFSFSPSSIDLSSGLQDVTASIQMTDDLAGASSATVYFQGPSFQSQYIYTRLVAGTPLDGTFEGTLSFPQESENGIWTVSWVYLYDNTGNSARFDTAALTARGFPTELTITSVDSDNSGPTLTSIDISPAQIDVSDGPQTVNVTLGVEDDISGATFTESNFTFEIRSPSGNQSRFLSDRQFTLEAGGTPQMGNWQATLEMPRFSESGTWQIYRINLIDVAANRTYLYTTDLQTLGLPIELEVISSVSDNSPPELYNFDFSPKFINTSKGSQQVTVTMDISDDLTGTDFSFDTPFRSYVFGAYFRSPSAGQSASAWNNFSLTQGDANDGIWEGFANFRQYTEQGTWRVEDVILKDKTRNTVRYT